MRFCLAPSMMPGHVLAFLPLVRELVGRGHCVLFCAEPWAARLGREAGAEGVDVVDYSATRRLSAKDSRKGRGHVAAEFARRGARRLMRTLEREPVHAALVDQMNPGAALVMRRLDVAWASLAIGPALSSPTMRDWPSAVPLGALRRELGLPASHQDSLLQGLSPRLHFLPWVASLDVFPAPPQGLHVGTMTGENAGRPPRWLSDPADVRPRLLVSSSTSAARNLRRKTGEFVSRLLSELDGFESRVLVTGEAPLGGRRARGVELRFAAFADHSSLMPHFDLVVTHGGWGTIMSALRHAVPVLVAPFERDQPFNGRLCRERGLGLVVDPRRAPRGSVRRAVEELLTWRRSRRAALDKTAREIARAGGVRVVADALIALAGGARGV